MISLLEHEGKELLAGAGIPIPAGALFPALPDDAAAPTGFAVKVQIPAGGRGKMGGIKLVDDAVQASLAANELLRLGTLGGHRIEGVYVEQKLEVATEIYLAVTVDRDAGCAMLLGSRFGGVDIEAVDPDDIVSQRIDPGLGLRPFALSRVMRELGIDGALVADFTALVERLVALRDSQDCELIEINPLVVTRDGKLIAADCKVTLDEDAAYRHPDWRRQAPAGSGFEMQARELGVIGVEIAPAGRVVAIMNGAGLTMATLDELVAMDVPPRAVVELHGITAYGSEGLERTLALCTDALAPEVIFLNVHFQFRSLDIIADALLAAIAARGNAATPAFVVRLKGERLPEAIDKLRGAPVYLTESFSDACAQVRKLLQPQ